MKEKQGWRSEEEPNRKRRGKVKDFQLSSGVFAQPVEAYGCQESTKALEGSLKGGSEGPFW